MERFQRCLHENHGIKAATTIFGACLLVCVALSLLVGWGYSAEIASDDIRNLAGTLVTIAEVLAGVGGILFAVIVFGIQFHGERLRRVAFLVRYLQRREGLIPIAAWTLAVIASNVGVALIAALWLPHAAECMAFLDFVLVPLTLWLALWLLYRMAISVSDDFFKWVLPSLSWEYDRAVDEEIYNAAQVAEFERLVKGAGLRHSSFDVFGVDPKEIVPIALTRRGKVRDVNIAALQQLGRLLSSRCPEHEATLLIGPGDVVSDTDVLRLSPCRETPSSLSPSRAAVPDDPSDAAGFVLTTPRDDQDSAHLRSTAIADDLRRELGEKLDECFRIGGEDERDVIDVLEAYTDAIVHYAKEGSVRDLERGLEVQGDLIARGLARTDYTARTFSLRRRALPDFFGNFAHVDVAEGAVASNDYDKVKVLLLFADRLMNRAIDHGDARVFNRAAEIIEVVYQRSRSNGLADHVSRHVDSSLYSVFLSFAFRDEYPDVKRIARQRFVVIAALGWVFRLVILAVRAKNAVDARNFHGRLFEWDKDHEVRNERLVADDALAPEIGEVVNLYSYAEVVLAAWLLRLVRDAQEENGVVTQTLRNALNEVGSRENLLRVWESMASLRLGEHSINDLLGITRLSREHKPLRAGEIQFSWGKPDAWVFDGFVAVLLARPSASSRHEVPACLSQAPAYQPVDESVVRHKATELLDDPVRREALGVSEADKDKAIEAVVNLFAGRRRLYNLTRLKEVVAGTVAAARVDALKQETIEALPEKRRFLSVLEKVGALENPPAVSILRQPSAVQWLWKERLLATCQGPTGFGTHLAEGLGNRESIYTCHAAEQHAEPVGQVSHMSDIADEVRKAISELVRRGFKPSMIFIPRERRFVRAIAGQSEWQMPGHHRLGFDHVGTWESCEVVKFFYSEPRSVVVLDAAAFYGGCPDRSEPRVEITITEPRAEEHNRWVAAAEDESDPSKIPEVYDVQVVCTAKLEAGVGLRDLKAAVRVDLDVSKLGYAMQKGGDLYHRPTCKALDAGGYIEFGLCTARPGDAAARKPCPACKPEAQDWED